MYQLEHIEAIEKRLWTAADTLRANSEHASNEYFRPVMGLVFLRHAYSRYLAVKDDIEAGLPTRGGRKRPLTKEDFSQRSAIFLREEAQFDHLVALPDGADRARAIIATMESIEADYESLRGVLPKGEYQVLDNDVLGQLLRTLNPDELQHVSGDVFGRIYEYFLTRFADQKAHDGGEFFTPVSLVSLIARVLDPERGTVLDPACGSGGMFVQSARTVEEHEQNPAERLTFRGLEKNGTTIRLAKMNLAVHGLEGDIQQAITYYEDPHELAGKADYVMANPPFNVDEIDADKVRRDPRLPFGLPGVNKKGKVSNGNYVWISYFYRYLNERGRAGFVMSSQASSAGGGEAELRRKLVETGDVEVMISIRSNFFYTRTVPCELWFLDRAKSESHRDKVLMLDARGVFRKVSRKICDFRPEQQHNLLAIVWLYRGEPWPRPSGRPASPARRPPDRDLRAGVRRQIERRLEHPRHQPSPQGCRRGPPESHAPGRVGAGAGLGAAQEGRLLLAPRPLADRTLPRRGAVRRAGARQAGGPRRYRGERLEPHSRPLRRGHPGRGGRGLRLCEDHARDPREAGRAQCRSGHPGREDQEELRGAGDMNA